jgi:hypothetical protein
MTDPKSTKTNEEEKAVRDRARDLWDYAGRPASGPDAYVGRARELIAIERNDKLTRRELRGEEAAGAAGVPHLPADESGPTAEPAEPPLATENAGEFPTLTDQGEQQPAPRWPAQRKQR